MSHSVSARRLVASTVAGVLVAGCAHHPREPRPVASTRVPAAASTAPVAAPAVPASAEAGLPIDPLTYRPVVVRHLDASLIEGQTWTFPSSNPQTFKDTRYVFKRGRMEASDVRRHTSGTWTVDNDKLCTVLRAADFGTTCYYVVNAPDGSPQILVLPGGDRLPLVIR